MEFTLNERLANCKMILRWNSNVIEISFSGFRDNAAKMKMSHGTSRETSWWVILVCVLAAVLTAFIFLSLLLMLKKQRRKEMDKETHYFTSGELGKFLITCGNVILPLSEINS